MIYVEFYKNKPFLISDISESEFEEYKKHADIREFESLEVFLLDYPDFESEKKRIDKLPQLRREAIKKADELAAEMQKNDCRYSRQEQRNTVQTKCGSGL